MRAPPRKCQSCQRVGTAGAARARRGGGEVGITGRVQQLPHPEHVSERICVRSGVVSRKDQILHQTRDQFLEDIVQDRVQQRFVEQNEDDVSKW